MEGLTMQAAIGYLRVSTREQGRSGLLLAAQRHEIEAFGAREGFSVKSWYQDMQTGVGTDALMRRTWPAATQSARALFDQSDLGSAVRKGADYATEAEK
jgi:hypothetical protein